MAVKTQSTPAQSGKSPAMHNNRGMLLEANFRSAIEALWVNRGRSFLTILGVIVGIAAVIAAVTITSGASALINGRLTGLGTNVLVVNPGSVTVGGARSGAGGQQTLTVSDEQALAQLPHVMNASPVITVREQLVSGSQNWNTSVSGVYPSYQQIQNWSLQTGAWFSAAQESQQSPVAVIGQTVYQNLFPNNANALGQEMTIGGIPFQIIGVLQTKGSTGGFSQDDVVFIPFTTTQTRLKNITYVNQIQVQADSANNVTTVQNEITAELDTLHNISAGGQADFTVRNPNQLVATAQQFSTTLTILLVSIAGISLIVGGIGIMNIMLVSVTERTREIGIRMAIGARRGDIRNQFLIESVALSGTGGILGIIIGAVLGAILAHAFSLPLVFNIFAIVTAFTVSAFIGIVFGLYPAIRAARLDPIAALRTE